MSIGFTFTGRVKKPELLIAAAKRAADERYYGLSQWEDGLSVSLCPLDGRVRMSWKKESGLFGQWQVTGECVSTPAGPGLHKAAVELVDALGLQKLAVEDETDYAQHRDFEKMCREHFYPWLRTLVEVCHEKLKEGGYNSMCLCWDMDQYRPEDIPGTIITPVGRFSARGMLETLEQKGVETLAERFFLWYHPGKRDALYDRQIALNLLWEYCYFAPSSRDREDGSVNENICKNLEMAARLDPALPLPRRAYEEVCALAGREPALGQGPELEDEFQPGFRKGLVTYAIGPVNLTLPGLYRYEREQWDERGGCDKWWDEASHSPIWRVNGYRKSQGEAEFTPALEGDNELTQHDIPNGAIRYGWREVEGESLWQVRAEVITGPSLFVLTVTHFTPEERPGIIALMEQIIAVPDRQGSRETIPAQG